MERPESERPPAPRSSAKDGKGSAAPSDDRADFEQIYRSAGTKPLQIPDGILKVVEMGNSQHLSGLSPEARRCAVLMALETAGAEIPDLLQDAVVRQQALNDYEKEQVEKLRLFEERKSEENRGLQAEMDRLTGEYMTRLQRNLDEVAHEQDKLRAWQRKKEQEAQRIADAAALCVPGGMGSQSVSMTAVLERACVARSER